MRKLLQEFLELELEKSCLEESLYRNYRNYLCERILNEITVKRLSNVFKKEILGKNEIDSEKATINVVKQLYQIAQQYKYEKKFGKIVPNTNTHLETSPDNFCTKETFKQEFEKEDFSAFEDKEDLTVKSLVDKVLQRYLEMYDKNGWLILEKDDYEKIKHE